MPLLGKIVVIKRNGTDGTEFPLTASCLFGRKLDCDIRIQLPQVSKEHCRIELNENKELILTNLSSVNPTLINGKILQQSERLKHGDLITVIDRSFRFEYPPAPTPKKKRLSTPGKGEAVKVLQDQQVRCTPGTTEKKSEHTTDTCLKDGSNLPACLDQSIGDQQNKSSMDSTFHASPFSDLYNMVKRDLATKPVWKSANTPLSRPPVNKQELEKISGENDMPVTPKSAQKKRRSSTTKPVQGAQTENLPAQVKTATPAVQGEQKRHLEVIRTPESRTTPQKFTTDQVAQQIVFDSPITKSPKARRSSTSQTPGNQTVSQNPLAELAEEAKANQATRTSPRANAGKRLQIQDVLQAVVATPTSDKKGDGKASSKKHKCKDLPLPAPKRKRVSFGGQLSPELFDKRLPPNSPLRRGATPGRRSLGFSRNPHSLLRRASTIGLMGYQQEEDITESPAKNTSPKQVATPAKSAKTPSPAKSAKTPSPAKSAKTPSPAKSAKTPSPAKKSPGPKAITPSPKNSRVPLPSSNQSTPKSSRRLSNASAKSASPNGESLLKTPTMRGRFSVSRISTPSPVPDQEKELKDESVPAVDDHPKCVTPRATPRRTSMKASARKSVLKSALNVVRSRRSGASRANLKVVSSWADIVKFGQAKPQMEGGTKKTATKRTTVKQIVTKPKTPVHRLKDHTSTGHAESPASIVVGKAFVRSAQFVGAAPKVVCNVALLKKDMKMDEDLTGLSDIFKTPANNRRKSAFAKYNECPVTPHVVSEMTEMSAMNTPEESGEMVVSPMSIASTTKLPHYNSEAVTRLLQDEQMDDSAAVSPSAISTVLDMSSDDQTENKKVVPVKTPQHKPAVLECLTGIKRLMRTPKQKVEPVEDLRGKLLKTPKEPKPPQEESMEGVKELLTTPKQKKSPPKDDQSGLKRLMKTPQIANSPEMCALVLKRLVKTPKDKTKQVEDLTEVKQLITPKQKKQPVDEDFTGNQEKTLKQKRQPVEEDLSGIQQMMKTPKQKKQPVEEDLTGIQQMMKTPKQKKQPVEEDLSGIQQMMKTPKQKKQPVEEDLTGIQQMMKTPKQKKQPVEEDLTGIQQMMETPKQIKPPAEEDLMVIQEKMITKQKKEQADEDLTGIQQMMKTPKQKKQPVEEDLTGIQQMMKTPKQKKQPVEEDLTGIQQMMETPKQIKPPAEEDLMVIQEKMITKQKKQPVEEDLTGIQQMMKTLKQKKQPVEEDLTGIQQMMKTPKQKKQPVEEDLTGIQQMMKTPKQKKQPVEEDLTGIQQMMKTPKQMKPPAEEDLTVIQEKLITTQNKEQADEDLTVLGSTMVVEFDSVGAGVFAVEDASEKSEEKENICPVEDMRTVTEAKTSCLEVEEVTSFEVMANKTVGTSEMISMAVEAAPSVASKQEVRSNGSSPAKKSRCGAQIRIAQKSQKSQEHQVASDSLSATAAGSEQETSANFVMSVPSVRGRRGKSAISLLEDAPIQSPVRKSTRGRIPKEQVNSSHASPKQEVLKPRRGRKAEHDVEVLHVGPDPALKTSVEVVALEKSPAPARAKRGRKEKHEPENAQRPDAVSEASAEFGVTPECAEIKPSAETEAPVKSNTRARRGRTRKEPTIVADVQETTDCKTPDAEVEVKAVVLESAKIESTSENKDSVKSNTKNRRGRLTKNEMLKTSKVEESYVPNPSVVESDGQSSGSGVTLVVQPKLSESTNVQSAIEMEGLIKPISKPRRGRAAPETTQAEETSKHTSDSEVLPEEPTQIPVVKSRRGRRVNPVALSKQTVSNESNNEPHVDESQPKSETPAVRSSRAARNKQTKLQLEVTANGPAPEASAPAAAVTKEPDEELVRNVRGGRRAKPLQAQVLHGSPEEAQYKTNIDSEAIQQSDVPAARSARGKRTAAVKEEQEAPVKRSRRAATVEVPPPVVKPSRGRKAAAKSELEVTEEATIVLEPVVEASKETKVLQSVADERALIQADSECVGVSNGEVPKRGRGRIPKKAKISTKDTSVTEAEESHVDEPQMKSQKKEEPAAEDESKTKQSVLPLAKGRKGRGAQNPGEPEKVNPALGEKIQPVRRGRAGTSVVPHHDEEAACPKRGQKRKAIKVVTEEAPGLESVPKTKRGRGVGAEVQTDAAGPSKGRSTVVKEAEEPSETNADEPPKKEKPVRGRRKATQEDVPPQAEDPASAEITTRRGARGQKKAETDVPSAPMRRTRRK